MGNHLVSINKVKRAYVCGDELCGDDDVVVLWVSATLHLRISGTCYTVHINASSL